MKYRIQQIKMKPNEPVSKLPEKICKKLRRSDLELVNWKITKKSIDARNDAVKFVYNVDFDAISRNTGRPAALHEDKKKNLFMAPAPKTAELIHGTAPQKGRPVIAGFGPCGMFAALVLAEEGYRPIVVERGADMDSRVEDVKKFWEEGVLNPESNVQFGEGGAGTFSDGKLTTGINNIRIRKVLETFVKAGAKEEILYMNKPHIGTDVLRGVVKNIREEIKALGGEVLFCHKLTNINLIDGEVSSIEVLDEKTGETKVIETQNLVAAIGHSARDTFHWLFEKGVKMNQKPFSIGVRIEHPQDVIDKSQYGEAAVAEDSEIKDFLPPADYKLSYHCENGRGVYTFCMCPGGEVIMASSEPEMAVTNGMSNSSRDSGVANSGLLVEVQTKDFPSEHPLAGVEFQREYERKAFQNGGYRGPQSTWGDFRQNSEKSKGLRNSLPEFAVESIIEAMPHLGKKLKGFDDDDALMTGVETRSSSPVRFVRDAKCQSNIKGLYPAGEGAGYAGGIVSAACDGIKVAEKIIENFAEPARLL